METVQLTIVSAMTGKVLTSLRAEPHSTVQAVKQAARLHARLLLDDVLLRDWKTLQDQGIFSDTTLAAVQTSGAVGTFECRWGRLGKGSIELRADGTASIRGHYRGGAGSSVRPWSLQLECGQNVQEADSPLLELVVDDILQQEGVPATPLAGKGRRNDANIAVGTTFYAEMTMCAARSGRVLFVDNLPWGRGESELPEVQVKTPEESSSL